MDNSLKNIFSEGLKNLSGVFHSNESPASSLGIDIGSSTIKVVQLRKKGGKAILQTYGALSLGPYAKKDIGIVTNLPSGVVSKALIDVIRESKVTIKSGIVSIPSSSSLVFTIHLPAKVNEDKLASIVPIEARKYIPIPISEVSLDWSIIPQEPNSDREGKSKKEPQIEVLVIAIHNRTLSRYQEILQKSQVGVQSYEMEIFSNIRSSLVHDLQPVLIIDFGASKTKLCIVEAGVIKDFHIINRGSADITNNISQSLSMSFIEAEKLKREVGLENSNNANLQDVIKLPIDYIFSEVKNIVFANEKKYNKSVSKVVLTGGGALLKGLLDKAKKDLKIEAVYSDPFEKTEAPAFLEPILKKSGPEFSVAVGLALRQLS